MVRKKIKVTCWWSGGVTSALACKLAQDLYGPENCEFIIIGTHNEDDDTYRFMRDCEKWYGAPITEISNSNYSSIQQVWREYESLNVATGAICSSTLKREVREAWQKNNKFDHQVFGFDIDEPKRAKMMRKNYPDTKAVFPLLLYGLSKQDCIKIVQDAGIEVPRTYQLGFKNNNCFKTGCVQGGVGYWQKMKREFPDKFNTMADMEWELTEKKGKPVTMLKDQSNAAKKSGNILVFLKKHPDYPDLKSIDEMPECEVEPLFECNGFCGLNDLSKRVKTEGELNFEVA